MSISAGVNVGALSSFTALDMQHFRAAGEQFSYVPFGRKPFDEVITFFAFSFFNTNVLV